jgi:D-alanyl-D-alanine carboxypeptidase (penicillin-binding protein 5/6)
MLTLHYDGPVRAPFAAGDKLAELEIAVAGMPPGRISLHAQHDVGEAGMFHRIFNSVMGLFA